MRGAEDNAIVIREMELQDIGQVAELERECFSEPWSEASLRDSFAQKQYHFLVAASGERVLGYIGLCRILDEGDITNVAVTSSARRLGIGERLLRQLLDACNHNGVFAVTLEVRTGNEAAIRLYEKCGFRTEGVRKNFYRNPTEDALLMWYRNN